jgi:hypothetical protein
MIETYSRLKLTYESDRLPGIAVVEYVHDSTGQRGRYLAGLWEQSIFTDLLWTCSVLSGRCHDCVLPTWSWASRTKKIRYVWEWLVRLPWVSDRIFVWRPRIYKANH